MKPNELFAAIQRGARSQDAALRLPSATPPYQGTWGGLCEFADGAAEWLRGAGIGEGDVVAITAEPELSTLSAILGAWKLDAAVTVLATSHGTKRSSTNYVDWLTNKLHQINAKLLVTSGSEAPLGWDKLPVADWLGAQALHNPTDPVPLADLAVVLQLTSGSTGETKIVPVTASAAIANMSSMAERL